jgi:geranylgeranyl pyrophosphate synthase
LATALGQYWDTQNPSDEEGYWRLVRTKSCPFFGAALLAGAVLGDAGSETAGRIKELGHLYGEMIQIHDDLNDALAVPANPDWTLGRAPLPILFAQTVDHPEKARFLELRRAIADPAALNEAQAILVRSGAVGYAVHHLHLRYRAAKDFMAGMQLAKYEGFEGLFETVMKPVRALYAELGSESIETLFQAAIPSAGGRPAKAG